MMFAAVMAASAVVSAAGVLLDDRILVGAPIWLKPFKFSVSFALYAVTLAWMVSFLCTGSTARRVAGWAGTVIVAGGAIEMAVIVGQVIRGRRSHFNVATDFDEALYSAMGATIAVFWMATLVIAVVLLRAPIRDRAAGWSIRLGVLLALVGMGLGALMTRPTPDQEREIAVDVQEVIGAHSVGVPDGGPGLPVTGWSTTGGDLRIPHFVGMHALQALPLLALLLAVLARSGTVRPRLLDPTRRLRLVVLASAVYFGLLMLLTWQALRGQPLLHPDAATTAGGVALLGVAAVGTLLLLRAPTRSTSLPGGVDPVAEDAGGPATGVAVARPDSTTVNRTVASSRQTVRRSRV